MWGFFISYKEKLGVFRGIGLRVSLDVFFMIDVFVDEVEGGYRGVGIFEGGYVGGIFVSVMRSGY